MNAYQAGQTDKGVNWSGNTSVVFETEALAKEYFCKLVEPWFWVHEEIWLRHVPTWRRLRVDCVLQPREPTKFPHPFLVVEIKRGHSDPAVCAQHVRQTVDYVNSLFDDKRMGYWNKKRVGRAYMFSPMFLASNEGVPRSNRICVSTVQSIAGAQHVGTIAIRKDYGQQRFVPEIQMSGQREWSSDYGATKLKLKTARRVGSGVNVDAEG